MNNQSDTLNQKLRPITKNGSIHLGLVEDKPASPPTRDSTQLELEFNQPSTDYH